MAGMLGDIPYGTLDLMILKTLQSMGPLHGFGLARQIEQVSDNLLQLNQGSVYPALQRLVQEGWIQSEWGVSESNRRAKYYSITNTGRKQLRTEVESWHRTAMLVQRFLALET
jgi:PadR family transcriptional regulator, regulatory protein PadR